MHVCVTLALAHSSVMPCVHSPAPAWTAGRRCCCCTFLLAVACSPGLPMSTLLPCIHARTCRVTSKYTRATAHTVGRAVRMHTKSEVFRTVAWPGLRLDWTVPPVASPRHAHASLECPSHSAQPDTPSSSSAACSYQDSPGPPPSSRRHCLHVLHVVLQHHKGSPTASKPVQQVGRRLATACWAKHSVLSHMSLVHNKANNGPVVGAWC